MTLIKSLLLGSAAGIVAVASAQAADLPTKKAAPAAEYVRICNVGGVTGYVIPGTDTCLKVGGLLTAQYTVGTTADQYRPTSTTTLALSNLKKYEDAMGFYTRGRLAMEAASNTAYGPLYAKILINANFGQGFDSGTAGGGHASFAELDTGYLTWAGLTAGKKHSFFDVLAGSINTWDDIITPDQNRNMLAYTASFGGGFSATISIETPNDNPAAPVVPGASFGRLGVRAPDIVGSLDVNQGWGSAKLAGAAHDVRVEDAAGFDKKVWGYAVTGAVTFNIPSMPGSDVKVQAVYAHDAINYSGLLNPGAFNYSGMGGPGAFGAPLSDVVSFGGGAWGNTNAWSVAGGGDFAIGPTFKISPEASYGQVNLTNNPALSGWTTKWSEFVGGGTFEWTPVKNLVFDLDLLYATGKDEAPHGYVGVGANAWKTTFSGFNGKLRIERDF